MSVRVPLRLQVGPTPWSCPDPRQITGAPEDDESPALEAVAQILPLAGFVVSGRGGRLAVTAPRLVQAAIAAGARRQSLRTDESQVMATVVFERAAFQSATRRR